MGRVWRRTVISRGLFVRGSLGIRGARQSGGGMFKKKTRVTVSRVARVLHFGVFGRAYLILPSLYSTCLRATGSYFFTTIFSVMVRAFFLVT